jgi:DNA-binding CsgD family transcriptional regulator
MRALVCDGPWLLTWIGGFRDEPFTSLEESALARLIAPLQRQLQVDRILGGSCSFGTLASALEAIASPAFLARPTGAIDFANEAGRRLFTCRGSSLAHSLRSALAAPERAAHATVLPLHSVGAHGLALIVLRGERVSDDARLSMVRARWGLTAREGEVLALTARGDANKDIAAKLRCSPRTAERHVTALLRKAKVDTRARLVAKYWTET